MLSKKELNEQIERIIANLQFYDKHKVLPFQKQRIDITLSAEVIKKLEGRDRSALIENALRKELN